MNNKKKERPTFCLNMIVKDEAHIICESLSCMVKYISYWVISDTGSTDGTQDIIREFFKKKKIPGELIENKWENFAVNRTIAMEKAIEKVRGKIDYLIIIDADDIIVGDIKFPKKMKSSWYELKYRNPTNGFSYERYQIFSTKLDWCYLSILHEYPELVEGETKNDPKYNIIPGDYYIESRRLGARSKVTDKYARDAKLLSEELEKEIAKKKVNDKINAEVGLKLVGRKDYSRVLIPRYTFYSAQSYKDDNQKEKAIEYYKRYTTVLQDYFDEDPYTKPSGNDQELYYAHLQLGNLMQEVEGYSESEISKVYLTGSLVCPARAECLFELGCFYEDNDKLDLAYFFLKKAAEKSFPQNHTFFIDTDIHTYQSKYELANVCFLMKKYNEAKEILEKLLSHPVYRRHPDIKELYDELSYVNIEKTEQEIVIYDENKIKLITENIGKNPNPKLTLTITTCKRFTLFEKTMNSFINCCADILLIDRFICIDDNSSEEDRKKMQELYPFFEFVWKSQENKGHIASMNIIRDMVTTPYVLHTEDDFLFFVKGEYIKPAFEILTQKQIVLDDVPNSDELGKKEIAQVIFNRNYQEVDYKFVPGGVLAETKTKPKIKFMIHEYWPEDSPEYEEVMEKYGSGSVYWPHFSFRPSILKTSIYKKLGKFVQLPPNKDGTQEMFERTYANKYFANGYISAFFDKICCLHTGRKTWEIGGDVLNAYELNEESQFGEKKRNRIIKKGVDLYGYNFYPNADSYGFDLKHVSNKSIHELRQIADSMPNCLGFNTYGYFKRKLCDKRKFIRINNKYNDVDGIYVKKTEAKELKYKTLCVNLLRRPDRKYNSINMFNDNGIENYEFFEAVDGSKLEATEEIRKLFLGNDFGYRKGVVGCALSHYKIWEDLVADTENDFYLVFEDDITDIDNNYPQRMKELCDKMKFGMPDVLFLGYFMFDENLEKYGDIYNKSDRPLIIDALNKDICIGGTHNYLVSKRGAEKLLEYANKFHIKHGIDYFMKIVPGLDVCETQPMICFAEWVQTMNSTVDSDIQKSKDCFHYENEIVESADFDFHPWLDSFGSDIRYVGGKTAEELKELCEEDPECIGFNTLGYLKYHIEDELKHCGYYKSDKEGLYVHKARFINQKNNAFNADDFEYHDGLDATDNDIEFVGKKSVDQLIKLCERNPLCVGFNTLGFMKHYIGPIAKSPYISPGQGLYVHKERFKLQVKKTRVKMLCNWKSSKDVCEEFNHQTKGNFTWNDIQFVSDDNAIDYYLILNKPCDNSYFNPSKTIVIQLEPWCADPTQNWGVKTWGEWAEPSEDKFMHVKTHKKYLNSATWQLSAPYDELKNGYIKKTKNWVSSICSSKYFDPGHKKRIDFMKYVESKNDPNVKIDIFNHDNDHKFKNYQGPHPKNNKDLGITPYKYYFMAENNQERNFITEKIWEPILTDTLCFYWGCPNIADWVNPLSYVVLDLNDYEASFQVVKSAIENDLWYQRINIIRNEKEKVLDYYNLIAGVERAIIEDQSLKQVKNTYRRNFTDDEHNTVCFIHSCNLGNTTVLESLVKRIEDSALEFDMIYIVNIGNNIETKFINPKIKVIQYSYNTKLFEIPTINLMWKYSHTHPNTKILYLHTKGVSYGTVPETIQSWTDYMLYFLIDKFDLNTLDNQTDAIGVNHSMKPHPHFSGNFWWTNTNYIRTLMPIRSEERHDAEWWLLSKRDARYKCLHKSNIDHYKEVYPKSKYEK